MLATCVFLLFMVLGVKSNEARNYSSSHRIVGGENAPDGVAPHQVSIKSLQGTHNCGGSIIHQRWIITAAHCTLACEGGCIIEYGTNNLGEGKFGYVQKIFNHPNVSIEEDSLLNDIALMKMEKRIRFNQRTQPITLNRKKIMSGEYGRITGWGHIGAPFNVKNLQLAYVKTSRCRKDPVKFHHYLCIRSDKSSACNGDSGGPLVIEAKLAGVTSFGREDCTPGYLNYYTRVSEYIDWIEEVLRKNK